MVESVGHVATAQPDRYVKQLVSHLGHKLATSVDDGGTGLIEFDTGRCTLVPRADSIVLEASAADDAALAHVQDVVARHLERFGTRESLTVIWS